jgi:hypothetical protein
MANESVATAMQEHVITADEMRRASDTTESVSPSKFLPYRKMVAALEEARDAWDETQRGIYQIKALFAAIEKKPEGIEDLADLGKEMSGRLMSGIDDIHHGLDSVIASAKATTPRKRWEACSAPDDRADDEDLAREAAAAVVSSRA